MTYSVCGWRRGFSPVDIGKGRRWNRELDEALARTHFGIVCVTRENRHSPWLLFESGAIAKVVVESRLCPYLLGLRHTELDGPLASFQAVLAVKPETLAMFSAINELLPRRIPPAKLRAAFNEAWPRFQRRIRRRAIGDPPVEALQEVADVLRKLTSLGDFAKLLQPAPFGRLAEPGWPRKKFKVD